MGYNFEQHNTSFYRCMFIINPKTHNVRKLNKCSTILENLRNKASTIVLTILE